MSQEYDVEAEIKLDASAARGATGQLTNDLLELQRTLLNTGSIMLSVFKGVRPQLDMFSTSILSASGHMGTLRANVGNVREQIVPLGKGFTETTAKVSTLGKTSKQTGQQMTTAFQAAGRATAPLGSLVRNTIALGAAYLGIRALSSAFLQTAKSSFTLGSQIAQNEVALGAVIASTAGFKNLADPMAAGMTTASSMFRALQDDALKSVGTSQDLANIYTQITGPLSNAGASLNEVRKLTNDSAAAATVLGVDFAQAARDINLMSTGQAGMDTMLFRMLKSTGKITESTQEWNAMLPEKRLRRMQEALGGFAPAAAQFEKTLPGITSSFVDYSQRFRQVFMSGPLEALRGLLVNLVNVFRTNETKISSVLKVLGDRFAGLLNPVVSAFGKIAHYFIDNWESIGRRIEASWQRISALAQNYGPTLMAGAKGLGAAALVQKVAPGAVGAIGSGISAGMAGGAAVEGSAFASAISGVTHLIGVVGAMGGTFTLILPIVGALIGLVAVLAEQWDSTLIILGVVWGFLQEVFTSVWGLMSGLYAALMPLLKIVGVVIAAVLTFGAILGMFAIRIVWGLFVKPIITVLTYLLNFVGSVFTWIYEHIVGLFTGLAKVFGAINADLLPKTKGGGGTSVFDSLKKDFAKAMAGFEDQKANDKTVLGSADKPGGSTKSTVNDFRGSKIEVKQDFRDADPDRVWAQFVQGINDSAEQRLSSSLIPSFTR